MPKLVEKLADRIIGRTLATAKRWQRQYYRNAYEELRLQEQWMAEVAGEKVLPAGPDPKTVTSILVFKPDEIGDAVYALPAIAELRSHYPNARISVMCKELTRPIFDRAGVVDEILPVAVKVRWQRFPFVDLKEALAKSKTQKFDIAVFLRTYPMYFHAFLKTPAKLHVHARDPRLRSSSTVQPYVQHWGEVRAHQALQMLQIVSPLTGKHYQDCDIKFPKYQWSEDDERALKLIFHDHIPKQFGVIHPYANLVTREYPLNYLIDLMDKVAARFPIPWVVIGAPNDLPLPERSYLIQAQGKLKLTQSGFLISRAAAFIGSLSGPMHWAGTLGTPTVALNSGYSAPSEWSPRSPKSLSLRIDVPCAPCHLRTCWDHDLACLKGLTPERVYPSIESFLQSCLSPSSESSAKSVTFQVKGPEISA